MSELFTSWHLMVAFFAASTVLAVTPGPGVIYIVTRTLAQGRAAGLTSVAGVALGNLGNAIGASIGLAALFAISSLAFTVVKYAGAAYLVYLGIKALKAPAARSEETGFGTARLGVIFRDGFVVALLNPKTTIFFAAFLPQFMDPAGSAMAQSMTLGAIFVVIAATTDSLYALAAGAIAPMLSRMRGAGAVGRYVTATTFIGLGVLAAAAGERPPK
jgi:threonine/homoserine/homoserine lactone efflux protein